jgi:hypothetical protein
MYVSIRDRAASIEQSRARNAASATNLSVASLAPIIFEARPPHKDKVSILHQRSTQFDGYFDWSA